MNKRIKIDVEKIAKYAGHKDSIYAMVPSSDKSYFFTSGSDGLVVKWDADDAELGAVVAKVQNTVYAIHFLEERNQLLVGQNFEGIHLIDFEEKIIIKSAKISDAAIFDIKTYGELVYVATGDGTLVVLELENFTTLARIKRSDKHARCLAVNPKSHHLAVGYSDNFIRIFDLQTFDLIKEWEAHENSVFTLRYSPDNRFLLSGSRDAHLKIWDCQETYLLKESIVAHMYTINHIAYRPDGRFFATCSKDKSIKVWDANTFKLLKVIDKARHAGHGTSVNKLFWGRGEGRLFSCSDDTTVSSWALQFNFPA